MSFWKRRKQPPVPPGPLLPGKCECGHERCFHERGTGQCTVGYPRSAEWPNGKKTRPENLACDLIFVRTSDDAVKK